MHNQYGRLFTSSNGYINRDENSAYLSVKVSIWELTLENVGLDLFNWSSLIEQSNPLKNLSSNSYLIYTITYEKLNPSIIAKVK